MKKYFVIAAGLLLAGCGGWSGSYWVHNTSDEKVTVNDTEVEPGKCVSVSDSFTIDGTEYSEEGHYQWDGSEAKKVSAEDVAVCKEATEDDGEDTDDGEKTETPATPEEAEAAAKAAAAAAVAAAQALDAGTATYKAAVPDPNKPVAEHLKPARELAWAAKNAGEQAKAAGEAEGVSEATKTAVTEAVAAVEAALTKAKEAGITPAFKPAAKS